MSEVENTTATREVARRTVLKGAAWSVPVIAVAAAAPLASASGGWNGRVTAFCNNQYDLSALQSIIGTGLGSAALLASAQTALALINLHPGAARGFTITAQTGTIPQGTQYTISDPNAILTLGGLQALAVAGAAGIVTVAGGYRYTLPIALTQGQSITFDLYKAIVNAGLVSGLTITQNATDASAADNSASTSTLAAVAVNLGNLGVIGLSGSLVVQTCA